MQCKPGGKLAVRDALTIREIRARMPRRQTLFWDVNPRKIDPTKSARYVVRRVMMFGNGREKRWLTRAYTRHNLCQVLQTTRGQLSSDMISFWASNLRCNFSAGTTQWLFTHAWPS